MSSARTPPSASSRGTRSGGWRRTWERIWRAASRGRRGEVIARAGCSEFPVPSSKWRSNPRRHGSELGTRNWPHLDHFGSIPCQVGQELEPHGVPETKHRAGSVEPLVVGDDGDPLV